MAISNNYEQHVSIMKNLNMGDGFYEVREPYKQGFEAIYQEAKNEHVTMSNAKEFLNSLSSDEMSTLQHYTRLADEINVGSLSDEGAYNLLLHHYEKFDFNQNGITENGIAKTGSMIPMNMPAVEKQALVDSLNQMDDKERFTTMALLNPPQFRQTADGSYETYFSNEVSTYEDIMARIDRILNPLPGEYRSNEIYNAYNTFKDLFEKNYEELSAQNAQQQALAQNNSQAFKAKLAT